MARKEQINAIAFLVPFGVDAGELFSYTRFHFGDVRFLSGEFHRLVGMAKRSIGDQVCQDLGSFGAYVSRTENRNDVWNDDAGLHSELI